MQHFYLHTNSLSLFFRVSVFWLFFLSFFCLECLHVYSMIFILSCPRLTSLSYFQTNLSEFSSLFFTSAFACLVCLQLFNLFSSFFWLFFISFVSLSFKFTFTLPTKKKKTLFILPDSGFISGVF